MTQTAERQTQRLTLVDGFRRYAISRPAGTIELQTIDISGLNGHTVRIGALIRLLDQVGDQLVTGIRIHRPATIYGRPCELCRTTCYLGDAGRLRVQQFAADWRRAGGGDEALWSLLFLLAGELLAYPTAPAMTTTGDLS